jgi:uncharacterized repeat protein (TIGR03803 family)
MLVYMSMAAGRCLFLTRVSFRVNRLALAFCVCLVSAVVAVTSATAATETVLHSFQNNGVDGYDPTSALVYLNGKLYGVTFYGGAYNDGTVFSIIPSSGAETVVYSFGGTSGDGTEPFGKLLNIDGTFYGTTNEGGMQDAGTLFRIDPATRVETVLYSFQSGYTDGALPRGALLKVKHMLYGTTLTGKGGSYGAVFSFDLATKTEKLLCSFNGTDGNDPNGGLVDINGKLYGTTIAGGEYYKGNVFSVALTTETPTIVYSFTGGADGGSPMAGLIAIRGGLYGTAGGGGAYGEGTVFSLDPKSGKEKVLYSFRGGQDGAAPYDPVIDVSGTLYGTTLEGGADGWGTVFSVDRASRHETVLYSFTGQPDGLEPFDALVTLHNKLYGTTGGGGSSTSCDYGCGTVFEITP